MLKENNTLVPPIINTRIFRHNRELVFKAWSDPELVAQWWGPNGFTSTIHRFEFRNAGQWNLTMHGPGGTNFYNESRFLEIIPNEKIVIKHLEPMHVFTATALFDEKDGETLLIFSMIFEEYSEYEKLKDFITAANEENFDRLESVLDNIIK